MVVPPSKSCNKASKWASCIRRNFSKNKFTYQSYNILASFLNSRICKAFAEAFVSVAFRGFLRLGLILPPVSFRQPRVSKEHF